jgi:hypothetical protein
VKSLLNNSPLGANAQKLANILTILIINRHCYFDANNNHSNGFILDELRQARAFD